MSPSVGPAAASVVAAPAATSSSSAASAAVCAAAAASALAVALAAFAVAASAFGVGRYLTPPRRSCFLLVLALSECMMPLVAATSSTLRNWACTGCNHPLASTIGLAKATTVQHHPHLGPHDLPGGGGATTISLEIVRLGNESRTLPEP